MNNTSDSNDTNSHSVMRAALIGLAILLLGNIAMQVVGLVLYTLSNIQLSLIGTQIVVILGAALAYHQFYSNSAAWPTFRRGGISLTSILAVSLTTIFLAIAATLLMEILVVLIPSLESSAQSYLEQMNKILLDVEGLDWVLGVIAVVIVAPICEELLFRGTILQAQLKHQPVVLAVVGNGLLFAAFHLVPVTLVSLTVVGCFLAHVTAASQTIWLPILAHALLNGFNGLVLPQLFAVETTYITDEIGFLATLIAAGATGLITFFLWKKSIGLLYSDLNSTPDNQNSP